ncbi:MAG: hypothetical protein JXR07_02990 [Reichenbachiella sp.]
MAWLDNLSKTVVLHEITGNLEKFSFNRTYLYARAILGLMIEAAFNATYQTHSRKVYSQKKPITNDRL